MRLLVLTKYGSQSASTRHRFQLFYPGLKQRGFTIEERALFTDSYLEARFTRLGAAVWHAAQGYLARLRDLIRLRRPDVVWLHSELFPYFPLDASELAWLLRAPYVVDLDDAVFHIYDRSRFHLLRRWVAPKFSRLLLNAAAVTAGSPYLVEYASRHCSRVVRVPTVVDADAIRFRPRSREAHLPVVGWIGSPSTTPYLDHLRPAMERLVRRTPVRLLAVGGTRLDWGHLPLEQRAWDREREESDLADMDVGIMPLPDEPWTRGKCGFKLIQYMASGAAVVSSPVGVNREIVEPSCGFFATDEDEWVQRLSELVADPKCVNRMGRAGRARVEARYSLRSQQDRVCDVLVRAAG